MAAKVEPVQAGSAPPLPAGAAPTDVDKGLVASKFFVSSDPPLPGSSVSTPVPVSTVILDTNLQHALVCIGQELNTLDNLEGVL